MSSYFTQLNITTLFLVLTIAALVTISIIYNNRINMALDQEYYDEPQSVSTYTDNAIIYATDIEDNGFISLSSAATGDSTFTFDSTLYASLGAVPGLAYSFTVVNDSAHDLTLATTGANSFSIAGAKQTTTVDLVSGGAASSVFRCTLLFLSPTRYVITVQ